MERRVRARNIVGPSRFRGTAGTDIRSMKTDSNVKRQRREANPRDVIDKPS